MSPPSWFKPDRYKHLNCAKSRQAAHIWLTALERCSALKYLSQEDWEKHASRGSLALPSDGSPPTFCPAYIGLPSVEAIQAADQLSFVDEQRFGPTLTLRLNLNTPDEMLLQAVRKGLAVARAKHPSPAVRPGRQTLNTQFTARHFTRWWDQRIVQIAELDWWAGQQSQTAPPKSAELARWIFNDPNQPTKKISEARKVLDTALGSIFALWSQCNPTPSV